MAKEFLTVEQQVKLLESRGAATDASTPQLLLREGYYSIVNGYKTPFIDSAATRAAGDDRFVPGTSFASIYSLFVFDRKLRELTFRYLIRAEATVRTAIAYCFSEAHCEPDAYLLQQNFCSKSEYEKYGKRANRYADEIAGLTSALAERVKNSRTEFVVHYRQAYGVVPLWVLSNDLTFGNLEHFFNLMKPAERDAFCKVVSKSTGRLGDKTLGFFKPEKAQTCLETLVKFRNICAHDERLYCARVGGRKSINYAKMVWMLERFLTASEFNSFLNELIDLSNEGLAQENAVAHILRVAGFSEITDEIRRRLKTVH